MADVCSMLYSVCVASLADDLAEGIQVEQAVYQFLLDATLYVDFHNWTQGV